MRARVEPLPKLGWYARTSTATGSLDYSNLCVCVCGFRKSLPAVSRALSTMVSAQLPSRRSYLPSAILQVKCSSRMYNVSRSCVCLVAGLQTWRPQRSARRPFRLRYTAERGTHTLASLFDDERVTSGGEDHTRLSDTSRCIRREKTQQTLLSRRTFKAKWIRLGEPDARERENELPGASTGVCFHQHGSSAGDHCWWLCFCCALCGA